MKDRYLEVTFRHGRPIAAYYYLPRGTDQKSVRTRRVEPGLIIDFARGTQCRTPRTRAHSGQRSRSRTGPRGVRLCPESSAQHGLQPTAAGAIMSRRG